MNKERRKAIEELTERASAIVGEIETLRDEEQEYFDNMPESMQSGEKGQAAEEAIDALDNAISEAEELVETLNNATA